jgi:hypothetical protein
VAAPPYRFLVNHLTAGTYAFSAKVTDGAGVSVGTPAATVVVQPLPLHKLVIHHLVPDQLLFCFQGYPGSNCIWQTTTALGTPWAPFATNTVPTTGLLQRTNVFPAASPVGFYRTQLAP